MQTTTKGRLFGECLWMPGLLHILDGVMDEGLSALSCKARFLQQLRCITSFFRQPHSRELFCNNCLLGENRRYRNYLENFSAQFIEWRWHSLTQCLQDLLPLRPVLSLFWDQEAMQTQSSASHDEGLSTTESHATKLRTWGLSLEILCSGVAAICWRCWGV